MVPLCSSDSLPTPHTRASEDTTLENSLWGRLALWKASLSGTTFPPLITFWAQHPQTPLPLPMDQSPSLAHKCPREGHLLRQAAFGDFLRIVTRCLRMWGQSLTPGPDAASVKGNRSSSQPPPGPRGRSSPSRPPRPPASQQGWGRDSISPALSHPKMWTSVRI